MHRISRMFTTLPTRKIVESRYSFYKLNILCTREQYDLNRGSRYRGGSEYSLAEVVVSTMTSFYLTSRGVVREKEGYILVSTITAFKFTK